MVSPPSGSHLSIDRLKSFGIHAQPTSGAETILRGNTYAHKETIKRAGCIWDRQMGAWIAPSIAALDAVADGLAAGGPPATAQKPATKGAGEAQSPYYAPPAGWGSKHYHGHRERLRSRFLEGDAEALADYELLELILFFSIPRRDTKPLAKELIARFGSLGGVLAAEPERLAEIAGFEGPGDNAQDRRFTAVLMKAMRVAMERVARERARERPLIESWDALLDYLRMVLAHETAEQFRVLYLDHANALLRDEVHGRGTVDQAPAYPREIVRRALELRASAVILVHNHPSGDPSPSAADIELTRAVEQGLAAVDMMLHEHVILAGDAYVALKSEGHLADLDGS